MELQIEKIEAALRKHEPLGIISKINTARGNCCALGALLYEAGLNDLEVVKTSNIEIRKILKDNYGLVIDVCKIARINDFSSQDERIKNVMEVIKLYSEIS